MRGCGARGGGVHVTRRRHAPLPRLAASASSRVLFSLDEDNDFVVETVNPMSAMKKAAGAGGGEVKEEREEKPRVNEG